MFRKSVVWLVVLVLVSVMAACAAPAAAPGAGEAPAAEEKEPIKVGAIFDLSGPTSDVGTPYAQGLQDYVKWRNQNGGVSGHEIKLIFQDYGYEVPRAEQLYTQFVQEGVQAFMGWGTGDTEALRARIADDKIPFMSASYSHILGNPKEAPYNFLVGTTYSDQFIIVLKWILEDWQAGGGSGPPVVAFMHHPSPFGLSPWEQLGREFAQQNGIDATAYEMPRGATDYTTELTRIQESGARYVVFQTVSSPAALALKNASSLGMDDVTFICLNWCADEILVDLAGEAAEGMIGAMPFTPPTVAVEGMKAPAEFLESQGSSVQEKGLHYVQGWWTMAVMAEGIRRTIDEGQALTGENIKAALESLRDFETGGVTAPITFTPEDHRGSKAMRLFKVENGEWKQLTDFLPFE